jgi:L-iditol 2-dehydrogenase
VERDVVSEEPGSMLAAVVDDDGEIRARRVPVPACGPGEVLIRVDACGLCGSDLHAMRNKSWANGLIPGHEISGRVERLGSDMDVDAGVESGAQDSPLVPGMAVVVEPLESCHACPTCRAGRDSICPELRIAGVHRPGGLAEFIVAPAQRLYPFDPAIEPTVATLIEPLAVALHAIERAGRIDGERVLVLGGGTIGLLCAFAAEQAGARQVVIRTRYAHQSQLALDLEAGEPRDAALGITKDGLDSRFDLVIETVGGSSPTLLEASHAAKPGGRVVVLGLFEPNPPFDPAISLNKELGLLWGNCYQTGTGNDPDFARAARMLSIHHESLSRLITTRGSLETIGQAFERAGHKETGVGKLVVAISREARGERETDFQGP